jgi:hypothetical protein
MARRTCSRCRTSSSAPRGRCRSCAAWACSPPGASGRRSRSRRSSSSTRPRRDPRRHRTAAAPSPRRVEGAGRRAGDRVHDRDGAGWARYAQLRARGLDPMDVRVVV